MAFFFSLSFGSKVTLSDRKEEKEEGKEGEVQGWLWCMAEDVNNNSHHIQQIPPSPFFSPFPGTVIDRF